MCAITGILTEQRPLDDRISTIESMTDKLAHRGPDDRGILHIPHQALLGHRRLSIIDIEHGRQPMCSPDERYSLVFNGEIYNYVELRQSLIQAGERFESFSDTEVLLRVLAREGVEALQRLNGMFAFIFHDRKTNTWIAARDHFGIKPLYYTRRSDELVFASEIKSLFEHPLIESSRDDHSLHQYLTFQFCLGERTLFEDVHKVRPGHVLQGHGSRITDDLCFWDTDYEIDLYHTEEYFIDRVRDLVSDSVRLQLRSDVPVGGYLSGGIDSSLVCTLATQHAQAPIAMFHGRFR